MDSFVKSFTKPKVELPSDVVAKSITKGDMFWKYLGGAKPIRNISIDLNELFTQTMKLIKKIK